MRNFIRLIYYWVAAIAFIPFFYSCGSSKDIIYFQKTEQMINSHHKDNANYEMRIRPNDNLLILVSSSNPQAAEPYNIANLSRGNSTNLELQGYLVDENGDVNFPEIGKLHVEGFTKSELINLLQSKLSQYIETPIVNIRFMTYKVSVLGEVARPGTYSADNERISIPEALAKAGDMTIYGQRHDVLICRTENGATKFYHVDMTSPDVFFSECYYLQQNDIVYVQPNKSRIQAASISPFLGTYLSVTGLLLSITNLIINIVK